MNDDAVDLPESWGTGPFNDALRRAVERDADADRLQWLIDVGATIVGPWLYVGGVSYHGEDLRAVIDKARAA